MAFARVKFNPEAAENQQFSDQPLVLESRQRLQESRWQGSLGFWTAVIATRE